MPRITPRVHEGAGIRPMTKADHAVTRDEARAAGVTAVRTDYVARNQLGLINAGHKLGHKLGTKGGPYPKQKPRKGR